MNVAIIPARGGSKRIPRKNIRLFHGKPIIAYSIEAALASRLFDGGVWVSTEDKEIARAAALCGASITWRPDHLAEIGAPDCGTQEVTRHALTSLNVMPGDSACCIYAAAPLLTKSDLRIGFGMLMSQISPYAYAVDQTDTGIGWFYWGRASAFIEGLPLEGNSQLLRISEERAIDINTEEDWARAEQMYAAQHGQAAA